MFRRYLGEDGELGPVQAVTGADVGHVEKRLGLMFAVRAAYERYDVAFAVVDDDAPRE